MKRLSLVFFLIVCFIIIGHAIYLNTPWVNFEDLFAEAARTILNPSYSIGIENYWKDEANPLGYSLIAALFASFLGISFWSVRVPSLLGGIAILLAGWVFYRKCNFKQNSLFFLWVIFLSLNPLVWIYSGRATADILPVGLVILAFLFCYCAQERLWIHCIGGCCFSLASLVKYNSILLGLGFVYIIFTNQKGTITWSSKRGFWFLFYSLFPIVVLGVYFLVIYNKFGIVFIPEGPKDAMAAGRSNSAISSLAMYISYMIMLLALPSLISIPYLRNVLSRKVFFALVIVALFFGVVFWEISSSFSAGEMGFSSLYETLLSKNIFSLIFLGSFILAFFLFAELIDTACRERNRIAIFLLCTLLPFLIISSFYKPVQRYLLFCLPFFTFYLIVILGSRMTRLTHWMGWSSIAVFIVINVFSTFHQIEQGRASENMVQWVISNGYLNDTEPGAILPHVGHHFIQNQEGQKKYIVNTEKTPPKNFLHEESVFVFGKKIKTYYLIETEQDWR